LSDQLEHDAAASPEPPDQEASAAVDIHKPKAAHNWREFLVEIGTIILGILIALGLEQIAEDMRWKQAVDEARASIHEEIAYNNGYLQLRVRGEVCLARRMDQIETALTAAEASGRLAAVPGTNLGLSAQISDAQWQAARAAQTLAHFPHDELASLGRYYDTINTFKVTFLDREGEAWRWLGDLESGPHAVTGSDLIQFRTHLRSARRNNTVLARASRTLLDTGAKLDVKPADRGNSESWTRLCAETGLPLPR
jgi:hypothetical protein